MGSNHADEVDPVLLGRLRQVCLGLPEAYEEPAWTGVRWRVRKRTIAHVVRVDDAAPGASTRAVRPTETVTIVTFRSKGDELDALRHAGHPFFYAGWGRDVVGIVLDDRTDWDEVAELLTESFCVLAPKKLQAQVDRPPQP